MPEITTSAPQVPEWMRPKPPGSSEEYKQLRLAVKRLEYDRLDDVMAEEETLP